MGNLFCKQTSIPATSDLSTAIDPTGTNFLHATGSSLGRIVGATAELALELLDQGIGLGIGQDTANGLTQKLCHVGTKFCRWNLRVWLGFGRSPVRVSQHLPLLLSVATDIMIGEVVLRHVGVLVQIGHSTNANQGIIKVLTKLEQGVMVPLSVDILR